MSRITLIASVFVLCSALSCGGCKKSGGDEDYQTPDGELGKVLESMCGVLDRCPDAFGSPIAYRSRRECVAVLNFVFTCRLTETEVSDDVSVWGVEQNVPDIEGDAVADCRAWLADVDCDAIARGSAGTPCDTVLSLDFDDDDNFEEPPGTADVDESCEQDEDCKPELFCTGGGGDENLGITLCRVCRPRVGEGADCSMAPCAEGFWCRGAQSGDPLRCSAPEVDGFDCYDHDQCQSGWCNYAIGTLGGGWGKCDPGGDEGDDCVDEFDTMENFVQRTCRDGLSCEAGTCQLQKPLGAACTDDYTCEMGGCHESGICGAPDGEPCSWEGDCASNICVEETCGLTDGQCFLDSDCAGGEVCSGACQPPNCECSGCPVGQCTPSGSQQGCSDDFDCDFGDCVDGTCSGPSQVGDACTDSFQCYPYQCVNGACAQKAAPGAECGAIDSCQEPFLCIEGRCQMMNLTCAPASAGQRCAWLRVCDDNSYCDLLDSVTCKPRAQLGQVCQSTPIRGVETCAPGATCEYDEASGEQRCVALPKSGQACTNLCADSVCWGGTCRGAPVGTPCDYDIPCPTGLYCNTDRRICVPPGADGDECDDQQHCKDGFFCENYRSCVAKLAAGEDCNDTFECSEQLYCSRDTYTCVADLPAGADCSSNDEGCPQGSFCSSDDRTCQAAKPPAAQCRNDYECISGVCYGSDYCVLAECQLP